MEHKVIINKKPVQSGKNSIPDGALNGNGDLCAILGNSPVGMRIYIAKSDIWELIDNCHRGGIKPLGYADIVVPSDYYENYHVVQDMDKGEITASFSNGNTSMTIVIRVCKTENIIMIEKYGFDESSLPMLLPCEAQMCGITDNGIYRLLRGPENKHPIDAYASMKRVNNNNYCIAVSTSNECDNPESRVKDILGSLDKTRYEELKASHYTAWNSFWSKSSFSVSDKTLEMCWYASLYMLAISAGNREYPPGLYGNFITTENTNWKGDYHLNYNYQASFYAACITNHIELTDCYHGPLEDFIEKGKSFARKINCKGIYYPVAILPKGLCSEYDSENKYAFERLFLGQKSCAIHSADIMINRWYATRDKEYAKEHAYPFIKECLNFFEDYCEYRDGKYHIPNDAVHEVPYYSRDFKPWKYKKYIEDTDNILTLGLMNYTLKAAIDISSELNADEDKRRKWQHMLTNLAEFTTYRKGTKKVFRYTKKGMAWNESNGLCIQHIYPSCCISPRSGERIKQIARNTLLYNDRWTDGNAGNSIFPAAVRINIDPKLITEKLLLNYREFCLPNMLFNYGGGCLENSSTFANTLSEMALQSSDGTLLFFDNWNKDLSCSFTNLRANGAFLVSSSINEGKIGEIKIMSEAGYDLMFRNPFKKCMIKTENDTISYDNEYISMKTEPGDTIIISEI